MAGSGLRERNRFAAMAAVQNVAVELMRGAGFPNVTVEEIADAAGVSPSTVYRYFGTKEEVVLWGGRHDQLVETFAESSGAAAADVTPVTVFVAAATAVYTTTESDLLAQLRLVFSNDDLLVAFEHALIGRRHDVAAVFATVRGAKSAGLRDEAAAGACLGVLLSMLDRWQAADGTKSLSKMLAKAYDSLAG